MRHGRRVYCSCTQSLVYVCVKTLKPIRSRRKRRCSPCIPNQHVCDTSRCCMRHIKEYIDMRYHGMKRVLAVATLGLALIVMTLTTLHISPLSDGGLVLKAPP